MAKKIEMSKDEQQLYSELQKIVKQANQRLLRLERVTGEKGLFASKQLYDYLATKEINGVTASGRVRLSKSYNITQLLAVKKATEQFLDKEESTVKGIKKLKVKYEEEAEKELDFKQLNTLYRSSKNYTWIYEFIPKSEFWGNWVKTANRENWDKETFTEQIALRINKEVDVELKIDLEALYYYVKD